MKDKNSINDLSISNKNKKFRKNKIKKKSLNNNYKKINNSNISNSNRNIKINNNNLFIKNDIKLERIQNYSSNKIRFKNNYNILNNNKNKMNTIFKSNIKNKINNKNLSFIKKNNNFNSSFSKKQINSNNLSFLQKNNSFVKIGHKNNNNISMAYYSKTYKINNKKIKKYPIKLKYTNNTRFFDSNKICNTEPSISNKYKNSKNKNLIKKIKTKNSSLNCYYINNNKLNNISLNDKEKEKKSVYKELIIQQKKNDKIIWITEDKENNYNLNLETNKNNSGIKKNKEKHTVKFICNSNNLIDVKYSKNIN